MTINFTHCSIKTRPFNLFKHRQIIRMEAVKEEEEVCNASAKPDTYIAKDNRDDTDLTFRATLALNELSTAATVDTCTTGQHTYQFGCIRNHKTLLLRVAVFVFFAVLITLLETLLPGKVGFILSALGIHSQQAGNATFWSDG